MARGEKPAHRVAGVVDAAEVERLDQGSGDRLLPVLDRLLKAAAGRTRGDIRAST
ncbi:hypothetical protein [Amycolatopsis sp. SID8362]|uniref:hypothetical protein n=1 Tax=Amycolatopsis sp. SID8362 TaxID=2690346 RepID=UPI001EF17364|nr:hypothetical protein [Amycolatopsis sp. SID8362]